MLDQFLLTVNQWMTGGLAVAAIGCFLWGMVSVALSPCHMASIPLIVGYVGGQGRGVKARSAATYAIAFTGGLFLTIALVGIVCALLGRMLGDVGSWWTILVGAILIWVALDMLGVQACSMSGNLMPRLKVRGIGGAFVRRLLENSRFQSGGMWFRRAAGAVIGLLGMYFILGPFVGIP